MAGNDWINSYLEAILDSEPGNISRDSATKFSLLLRERGGFSPTRYFVEEVISGFDETDLFKTWVKAAATRGTQERNTRLENMCWRIWNLARRKKQIEGEEALRQTKRRIEREKARREATADMSEELSEGEKTDAVSDISAHGDCTRSRISRVSSNDAIESWASQHRDDKLYIVLISLHGLIRGDNMELGRDSDTGGQVKYVVELARALGSMPGVYRVDLLTRQISSPDVDFCYGEPTEMLSPFHSKGESSGSYIVRIPCGPKNKYLAKELLWPYVQEFVDGALAHVVHMSGVLGEQIGGGQPVWPVAIHGHYADAGDSAALLSGVLNVPMVFTGHSLGRDKLEQLIKQGRQSREEINAMYKIMRRIEAEELCLDASEIIIASTRQEIEGQWCLYDGFDVVLERKLRARIKRGVSCYGRFMPRMIIIPPGMEFSDVVDGETDGDGIEANGEHSASVDPPIWAEIMRFFTNPRKPMILALARPDPKKNIVMLVKAFGECRPLRELANLTLIMGNRDVIDEMPNTSASVLSAVLKLIDKYDLYGQVAYPKHHKQCDVPDIYRLAAKTKGVFINPAFIEPFGLTLIEAASHGLPIVATKNGGPVDIHKVLDNGLLVDPHDQEDISGSLLKLFADRHLWARCRHNGLKNIHLFSWPEHCKAYLSRLTSFRQRQPQWPRSNGGALDSTDPGSPNDSLRDLQDISLNLKLSLDGVEEYALDSARKANETVEAADRITKAPRVKIDSSKFRFPSRKNPIFVIAVDCEEDDDLGGVIERVLGVVRSSELLDSGLILSTSRTISEVNEILTSRGILSSDFDAFICSSGSEIYYPSPGSEEFELPLTLDEDYRSHIGYRWGGEDLRRTIVRWAASLVGQTSRNDEVEEKREQIITEDESRSSIYRLSFAVRNPEKVPSIKELRKMVRNQALRCHVIYSHAGSKLHVIPVLASRSQALRYLHVRWGAELSRMVVIVGEDGDTDYEGMIGGAQKTVILQGICSERKIQSSRGYALEDVVAFDSPNLVRTEGDVSVDTLEAALHRLGVLTR